MYYLFRLRVCNAQTRRSKALRFALIVPSQMPRRGAVTPRGQAAQGARRRLRSMAENLSAPRNDVSALHASSTAPAPPARVCTHAFTPSPHGGTLTGLSAHTV